MQNQIPNIFPLEHQKLAKVLPWIKSGQLEETPPDTMLNSQQFSLKFFLPVLAPVSRPPPHTVCVLLNHVWVQPECLANSEQPTHCSVSLDLKKGWTSPNWTGNQEWLFVLALHFRLGKSAGWRFARPPGVKVWVTHWRQTVDFSGTGQGTVTDTTSVVDSESDADIQWHPRHVFTPVTVLWTSRHRDCHESRPGRSQCTTTWRQRQLR